MCFYRIGTNLNIIIPRGTQFDHVCVHSITLSYAQFADVNVGRIADVIRNPASRCRNPVCERENARCLAGNPTTLSRTSLNGTSPSESLRYPATVREAAGVANRSVALRSSLIRGFLGGCSLIGRFLHLTKGEFGCTLWAP